MSRKVFREELERLLNRESMEAGSDTPDYVLAEYLHSCLQAFDVAVNLRERAYGRPTEDKEDKT